MYKFLMKFIMKFLKLRFWLCDSDVTSLFMRKWSLKGLKPAVAF